jgi:putative peptidoglycan lipid II flippase
VLAAYAVGLSAVVLIRSAVASFHARSDTTTPVIAALVAVAVNVGLKLVLMGPLGVVGLALATAIGAWVNVLLLFALAYRRDWTAPSPALARVLVAVSGASALVALYAFFAREPVARAVAGLPAYRDEIALGLLSVGGALLYGIALLIALKLLGVRLQRP